MATNKVTLQIRKDKINQHYNMVKGPYRLQLCGDPRKGGYWISQYAAKCGLPDFMKDFTKILKEMMNDDKAMFNLYISPEVLKTRVEEDNGDENGG